MASCGRCSSTPRSDMIGWRGSRWRCCLPPPCVGFRQSMSACRRWAIAALLAAALAAALVHSGHAAATAGWIGTLHRAADGLHLIAASAWLGGLVPLALLLAATRRGEYSASGRARGHVAISTLGLISVGILVATGIVERLDIGRRRARIDRHRLRQACAREGRALPRMVAIAGVNRLGSTPRLSARQALRTRPQGRHARLLRATA